MDIEINNLDGDANIVEVVKHTKRQVNLPFGEAFLLAGLDAHSAHADEIFQPSITETEA